mmetsp:Transcript_97849/g.282327  ORF Transcript_97849/g.282327 Transcript_97849/m.282327 type:complete len:230 (-) Transcript_97849:480-1169(-)
MPACRSELRYILRQREDELVHVARKRRVPIRSIHIAFGVPCRVQQRLQLVILHVDDDGPTIMVTQLGDRSYGLPTAPRHGHRVHVERVLRRDAQRGQESHEVERVRVLEKEDPPPALCQPTLRKAVRMQEVVDIAVPMRLCAYLVWSLHREARIAVAQRGHLLLHQNMHLLGLQAEAAVLRKKTIDASEGVRAGHDNQRQWSGLPLRGCETFEGTKVCRINTQHAALAS